jgi:hypothetical protein
MDTNVRGCNLAKTVANSAYDHGLGSTQPAIQWVPGALSSGVKLPDHETDHSPLASAEVKKMWIYTPTRPYAFMA